MFYVTILNVFNILTSKQIFWKTKTLVKKPEYLFLVESTKIENASFSYITAISEANVKTNKMLTTKWTYQKEWSSASNCFIFLKILCQLSCQKSWRLVKIWFDVLTNQMPIFVLFVSAGVLFHGGFSLWVSFLNEVTSENENTWHLLYK